VTGELRGLMPNTSFVLETAAAMRRGCAPAVLLLAASLAGCGDRDAQAPVAKPALTVELVSPMRQDWPDLLSASGEVAAWQEASIGNEIGGVRLDEVLVNVGDRVRKGQLLARFNEDTLRADLARLDAAVAEADANLARARADAERAERLLATESISGQQAQSFRTQAVAAEAQLASARAQRGAQALKLRYARVVAPDDGVISSRSATVGTVSNVGVELFRLVRGQRLEWRAEVPAASLPRLTPGLAVTVKTLDGNTVTGRLRQLSPIVDSSTRNGLAYVDLPADSGLAAGMYLSGHFTLPSRPALTVPESAVVLRDGNRYLMRIDTDNRAREIKVETGRRANQSIELLGGDALADGRYVASGGAFVIDGDLVRVVTTPAQAP
jgi:HlyD family secretion protein